MDRGGGEAPTPGDLPRGNVLLNPTVLFQVPFPQPFVSDPHGLKSLVFFYLDRMTYFKKYGISLFFFKIF